MILGAWARPHSTFNAGLPVLMLWGFTPNLYIEQQLLFRISQTRRKRAHSHVITVPDRIKKDVWALSFLRKILTLKLKMCPRYSVVVGRSGMRVMN